MNNNNSVFNLTFAYKANLLSTYEEMLKVLTDGLIQYPSEHEYLYVCENCTCTDEDCDMVSCSHLSEWLRYREYVSDEWTYIATGDIWKKIVEVTAKAKPYGFVKNLLDFPYIGNSDDLEDGKLYKLIYSFPEQNRLDSWFLEEIEEKDLI